LLAPTNVQGNRLKRTGTYWFHAIFQMGHTSAVSHFSSHFQSSLFYCICASVTSDAPLRVAEAAMHTNLFTTAAEQSSFWRTSQETRRVQMISRTQYPLSCQKTDYSLR
jgi:hypothetical protein